MDPQKKPPRKKQKRQTYAACDFSSFETACQSCIAFLENPSAGNLMNNIVLQYETIHALVRLGESLTFLRDDPNLPYSDGFQTFKAGGEKPSKNLSILMDFIYCRNQLLHHVSYKQGAEKDKHLKEIFRKGLYGQKGMTGIASLKLLLEQTFLAGKPTKLSKEIGPAPEFEGTIKSCIEALTREANVLKTITTQGSTVSMPALEISSLICCQILSDLQKTKDIQTFLNDSFHEEFDEMLQESRTIRERLAHALSFTLEERAEIEALLRKFDSETLLKFCAAAQIRLKEMEQAKLEAGPSTSPALELPSFLREETPSHSPITPMFNRAQTSPAPMQEQRSPSPVPSPPPSPFSVQLQPLVAYSSSDDESIAGGAAPAVDKPEEEADTGANKGAGSPRPK